MIIIIVPINQNYMSKNYGYCNQILEYFIKVSSSFKIWIKSQKSLIVSNTIVLQHFESKNSIETLTGRVKCNLIN